MQTTEASQELQNDAFIEHYLDALNVNGDNAKQRQQPQHVGANQQQQDAQHIDAQVIEAQIQNTFRKRVQKIHKDLIMQDQYVVHERFAANQRLFNV